MVERGEGLEIQPRGRVREREERDERSGFVCCWCICISGVWKHVILCFLVF